MKGGTTLVLGSAPKTMLRTTKTATHYALGSLCYVGSNSRGGGGPPRFGRLGAVASTVGASALLLGGKAKYLVGALKLTKFASLGSMLLSVGAYSAFFGLPYAVGMVSTILVHESGHALAMRSLGVPFDPMVFVPFFGAAVSMRRRPRDAYEEALIALGGPVLGTAGAIATAGAAHLLVADGGNHQQLLFAVADFGFMINTFNLLPIGAMDGGRICGALSPYAGVAGLTLGAGLVYTGTVSNPIFYLVMASGAYTTFQRFYNPHSVPLNYYKITDGQRLLLGGSYVGVLGVLLGSMAVNERFKKSPQQLQMESSTYYYQ